MNDTRTSQEKQSPPGAATTSRLGTALLILAIAGVMARGVIQRMAPAVPVPAETLQGVLPDGVHFQDRTDPLPYSAGTDGQGKQVGAVILTDDIPPSVRGYLGQVGAAVGLSPDGRITAVMPLRHRETPYYMEMVTRSGLLEEMAGIDMSRPFPALDAVSGATITSKALIEDVRLSATAAAEGIYSIEVPEPEGRGAGPSLPIREGALAAVLLLSLAAGSREGVWLKRHGIGLLTLAVVGPFLNTPLTLSSLGRVLQTDLPGAGNRILWFMLLYLLVSIPLQGRAYCRNVCPFGTLQDLASELSRYHVRPSPETAALLPAVRRLFTAGLLFLGVWAGMAGFTEVEPFFSLFSFDLTPLLWIVAIFVLAVSIFWRRFWCNTLCPTGTLLALASRAFRLRKGDQDETV